MWFNSIIREKPYQLQQGVAWLSSVRVLRCGAKARNGQNPHLQLLRKMMKKSFFQYIRQHFAKISMNRLMYCFVYEILFFF